MNRHYFYPLITRVEINQQMLQSIPLLTCGRHNRAENRNTKSPDLLLAMNSIKKAVAIKNQQESDF